MGYIKGRINNISGYVSQVIHRAVILVACHNTPHLDVKV